MEACGPQGLRCMPSPLQEAFTQPCTDPPTSKARSKDKKGDCPRSKILKRPNKQGRVLLRLESGKLEDVCGKSGCLDMDRPSFAAQVDMHMVGTPGCSPNPMHPRE